MKKLILAFFSLALVTASGVATPDITGKWKWDYERNGQSTEIVMTVKQEGSKITGKLLAPGPREIPIEDGKISDDGKVTFFINFERDSGPLKINFEGKAQGDKITGHTEYKNDQGEKREREWIAKRDAVSSLAGKWNSVFKRQDGTPMETTLDLKQEGEKLSGAQSFNDNESEIRDGKVAGDEVTFRILRERDGRTVTSKYRGKIQKDGSIKGEIESDWTGEVRKLEWEAKKAH